MVAEYPLLHGPLHNISEQTMVWYDRMIKLYDLCEYNGIRTVEHCCICIPGRVCADCFLTCMRLCASTVLFKHGS